MKENNRGVALIDSVIIIKWLSFRKHLSHFVLCLIFAICMWNLHHKLPHISVISMPGSSAARGQANKHKGEQNFTIFSSLIMDNCRARLSCRFPPCGNVVVRISPCRSWQKYAARINNLWETSVFIIGQWDSTVVKEKRKSETTW